MTCEALFRLCATDVSSGENVDFLSLIDRHLLQTSFIDTKYLSFNSVKPIYGHEDPRGNAVRLVDYNVNNYHEVRLNRLDTWGTTYGGCNMIRGLVRAICLGGLAGDFPYAIFNAIAARLMVNIEATIKHKDSEICYHYLCRPDERRYKYRIVHEQYFEDEVQNEDLIGFLSGMEIGDIRFREPTLT